MLERKPKQSGRPRRPDYSRPHPSPRVVISDQFFIYETSPSGIRTCGSMNPGNDALDDSATYSVSYWWKQNSSFCIQAGESGVRSDGMFNRVLGVACRLSICFSSLMIFKGMRWFEVPLLQHVHYPPQQPSRLTHHVNAIDMEYSQKALIHSLSSGNLS